MWIHDDEPRRLTRDDFDDRESWLRYCHEGGIDLPSEDDAFAGVAGSGFYGALAGAIYGHTPREYGHAWAGWGHTNGIGYKQLSKAYRAVAFANCVGCVMDSSIDITWSTVGITSDLIVAKRQKDFLDALRRWLARNGQWTAYLWVLERGAKFGLHTHILLHLPDELIASFRQYAGSTLSRIVGRPLLDTAHSKTMLIQPRRGHINAQWIRFVYMMKGITPDRGWPDENQISGTLTFAERAGIGPRPEGEVSVKRVGVSRALDDASFARWRALNAFPDMTISKDGPPLYDDRFLRWYQHHADVLQQPSESRNGNAARRNGNSSEEQTET